MITLDNKTVLVIGGGRGLGKSTALSFAKKGANVVVVSRTQSEIDLTANEIKSMGRRSLALRADVTNESEVNSVVNSTLSEFGTIDVLLNCQGEALIKPTLDTVIDDWDKVVDSNLKSVYLVCKSVLPTMVEKKSGHVFNISSKAGTGSGGGNITIYKAAIAGLIAFTIALADEHKVNNIKINVICPSPMDTPMRWSATPNYDRSKVIPPESISALIIHMCTYSDFFMDEVVLPNSIKL